MQIRLRHIDDTNSVLFTECRIDQFEETLSLITQTKIYRDSAVITYNCHHIVVDENSSYIEVILSYE